MTEPLVNMAAFLAAVQNRLKDSVVGYSCCIGNVTTELPPISGGVAQPGMPFTSSTQHGVASVAKVLTAVAAFQLLDPVIDPAQGGKPQNVLGLNLDSPMYLALPTDWQPHLNEAFKTMTFRDLLAHTSGLPPEGSAGEPGQDWASLKTYLTQGDPTWDPTHPGAAVKPPLLPEPPPLPPGTPPGTANPKVPHYSNIGFALFRLLLPNLNGSKDDVTHLSEAQRAQNYANEYRDLIANKVFGAVHVTGPDTEPQGNYEFEYPYPGGAGWDPSTWSQTTGLTFTLVAGSGCWWVSINEMAPVLASLSNSEGGNGILSPDQWLHMQGIPTWPGSIPDDLLNLPLGLDSVTPVEDPSGKNKYRFVWKNGAGNAAVSAVAFFGSKEPPSNGPYYAALFANSPITPGPTELNWWWCSKCQTLFYNGDGPSVCPATGSHSAGGQYLLVKSPLPGSDSGWKWCSNCQALCFDVPGPHVNPPEGPTHGGTHTMSVSLPPRQLPPSVCPAFGGGRHQCTGLEIYRLNETSDDPSVGQYGWKSCGKCGVLAFSGNGPGVCAADEWHTFAQKGHDFTGQDYWLWFPQENLGSGGTQDVLIEAFLAAVGP
jgi:CubicO group peptidase (beta-lactamase class C family)